MLEHRTLTPETPIDDVKRLFAEPPGEWPEHWAGFPNVAEAFREMFDKAADRLRLVTPPATWEADRGIVICAGGWRFFASLYVTVRMIRHVGCNLPIQVWYLGDRGEFDERMRQALERFDVGWIDGTAFAREYGIPRRVLGGWELKPFAALHAPYREVISLDADSYPAYNPVEFLETEEYARVGAAFWPDQGKLDARQWEQFGLSYHDEPAWESGQFIVDKARHWRALALADWLNDHSDYVYRHIYGDKDTFHLAWRKLGHEVCVPTDEPGWESVAFVQQDFEGRPLFIHRTRDKFRWDGTIDGMEVPRHYMTEQWHPVNAYIAGLPHEETAHAFCQESSELLRPELHFACRPNTCDRGIFIEVVLQNEYRLPPFFEPDDVIVDVGGHIGAFAYACLIRGAGKVITCEPEPGNLELLRKNLARFGDRVEIVPAAVWPAGVSTPGLAPPVNPYDTCQFSMIFRDGGVPVPTITLEKVLAQVGAHVRLLKLDCEGAEYDILDSSDLRRIQTICGEAHSVRNNSSLQGIEQIKRVLKFAERFSILRNGPITHLWWASLRN
jgi:FkbM family methyltransferase